MKPTVYGVGCLGGNLDLKSKINGKLCKIHNLWHKMIERCYSEKVHERCPTYIDCYVSDEFKDYSKWRGGMIIINTNKTIDNWVKTC